MYLLVLLVFGCYRLDVVDFNNFQDLESKDFEQQVREEGKCSLTMLNLFSFSLSSLQYCLHALIRLSMVYPSALYLDTLEFGICVWVD
jgi:hypothetical protein